MENGIIKKVVLLNLPCLILGVFLNWFWFLSRTTTNSDVFKAMDLFFKNPIILIKAFPLSFNPMDLLVGIGAGGILFLALEEQRANRKKYRKGTEHGTARWGTAEAIKEYIEKESFWNENGIAVYDKKAILNKGQLKPGCKIEVVKPPQIATRNNVILSTTEYLTMNSRPKNWQTARNKNVLVMGGSGSGKTRYVIKPNIMQMHSSYVVTDPKGTIVNELGAMLVKHGYKLRILNLINFNKSFKYNPMVYVNDEKDILRLVNVLMSNTNGEKGGTGDFWEKAEELLYLALIGVVCMEFPKNERNFPTIVNILGRMEVKEDDENFKNAVDFMFEDLEKENPNHFAVLQYKQYKLAAGKTAKSILISCAARLKVFLIPAIAELVSEDELNLEYIGEEKTALFIIIPDTDPTFNFIASIMYSQMFNLLCTLADDKYGGRLPVHVRCLLDEFANIGKIPNFEKLIATIRSREISAMIILQTYSQLKAIYKDSADTIFGNCDSTIFLGGKEKGTIKDLAEELGKETIDDYNTSDTRGSNLSKGLNYSKLGRDLMSRDELLTMSREDCIVQISGLYPFKSKKYELTKHPLYAKWHANDNTSKLWFDPEAYITVFRTGKTGYVPPKASKKKRKNKNVNVTYNDTVIDVEKEGGDEIWI